MRNASERCGGIYLYGNQQGCDGGRLYYDGCALIIQDGKFLAQGNQFSITDIEVVTAVCNLQGVRSKRRIPSFAIQADASPRYPRVKVDFWLTYDSVKESMVLTKPIQLRVHRCFFFFNFFLFLFMFSFLFIIMCCFFFFLV